eukprot:TRINITY_DN10658_c0_g1_i1.p1 TRINITY_DN10658_c0_g1~~TRINITY_DN10658_c0_g1_i1.p1  ORF type:complete len:747 (+),score=202.95 TRINITY_DN10658_c0_g1_i1:68-2308(+)
MSVEKDKAVIRIFLTDGTAKCFLVSESHTANAVKFLVAKKLGLEVKEFGLFKLYQLTNDRNPVEITEKPFSLHVKWGDKSGGKKKFLFKREDQELVEDDTPSSAPNSAVSQTAQKSSDNQGGMGQPMPGMGFGRLVTANALNNQALGSMQNRRDQDLERHKNKIIVWTNKHLEHCKIEISNLDQDFTDGVVFFRLLETLTNKRFKGWHPEPNTMMAKLDNHSLFLRTLGFFGIQIRGVSSEDLFSGDPKIIFNIMATLIKRYSDVNFKHSGVSGGVARGGPIEATHEGVGTGINAGPDVPQRRSEYSAREAPVASPFMTGGNPNNGGEGGTPGARGGFLGGRARQAPTNIEPTKTEPAPLLTNNRSNASRARGNRRPPTRGARGRGRGSRRPPTRAGMAGRAASTNTTQTNTQTTTSTHPASENTSENAATVQPTTMQTNPQTTTATQSTAPEQTEPDAQPTATVPQTTTTTIGSNTPTNQAGTSQTVQTTPTQTEPAATTPAPQSTTPVQTTPVETTAQPTPSQTAPAATTVQPAAQPTATAPQTTTTAVTPQTTTALPADNQQTATTTTDQKAKRTVSTWGSRPTSTKPRPTWGGARPSMLGSRGSRRVSNATSTTNTTTTAPTTTTPTPTTTTPTPTPTPTSNTQATWGSVTPRATWGVTPSATNKPTPQPTPEPEPEQEFDLDSLNDNMMDGGENDVDVIDMSVAVPGSSSANNRMTTDFSDLDNILSDLDDSLSVLDDLDF